MKPNGEKAIREILKQLLHFIISAQMDKTCCPCVLVVEKQQRVFLCSFVATLFLCSKGKEQAKDRGTLAYWKVGNTMLVPLGWWEMILGKAGGWWGQWVSLAPAPCTLMLIPAGHRRGCQSPSNTIKCFCEWSAADRRAAASKWTKTRDKHYEILFINNYENFAGQAKVPSPASASLDSSWPQKLVVIPDVLEAWGSGTF